MFWINVYQRKMKEGTFKALDPTSLLNFLDEPTLSEVFPSSTGNFRFEMLSSKTGSLSLASFSHDCRRPPITEVQKALRFYDDNYEIISQHHLTPGKKIFLGNRNDKKCRFCGGAEPEKSFKKAAHVIPESLGNKTLFSYYECDQCNTLFGDGIENDFGSWSKPMRTLARINGKRGSPTIKHKDGKWRVEVTFPQNIRVSSYEHNPDIVFDEENMEVTFNFRRDRYTPVAVLKSLVKMGLSILPSDEMTMFQDALLWIRSQDHSDESLEVPPVIHTFISGPAPNTLITLLMLKRRNTEAKLPYMTFIIGYANEVIQVFIPCPSQDSHIMSGVITLPRFPHPADEKVSDFPLPNSTIIKFLEGFAIEDEIVPLTMKFGGGGRIT